MWELDPRKAECWRNIKLWCWRRLSRVPWTARRSNKSILKEINPEYSLERLMLKLKLQYFGHLMQRVNSLEKPWCWESESRPVIGLFMTPWTVAHQALSMEFSRQEYWSGLPFPSPGDLPSPGIEPRSPTLQADFLPSEPPGKPVAGKCWGQKEKGAIEDEVVGWHHWFNGHEFEQTLGDSGG